MIAPRPTSRLLSPLQVLARQQQHQWQSPVCQTAAAAAAAAAQRNFHHGTSCTPVVAPPRHVPQSQQQQQQQRCLARNCLSQSSPVALGRRGGAAGGGSGGVGARRLFSSESEAKSKDAKSSPPKRILSYEDVEHITQKDAKNWTLVDVREPHELHESGRIPGAVNVPVTSAPHSFHLPPPEFEQLHGFQKPDLDRRIVVYCKAGVRSKAAAGLARDAGYSDVYDYSGSWKDWKANGGSVQWGGVGNDYFAPRDENKP